MSEYLPRTLEAAIRKRLETDPRKIVILYGQRQVGKTTLAKRIVSSFEGKKVLYINADLNPHAEVFSSRDLVQLKLFTAGYDFLLIDEAQRVPDIGINLKILHDNFPALRILVTGSSSLDLANRVQEALTGRTWTFHLHPFSAQELASHFGKLDYHNRRDEWLIYGAYPGVLELENRNDKETFLNELTQAYLYKDVLELGGIRESTKLRNMLRLLAFQIGAEVSMTELGKQVGLDTGTIARYIDLLEKSFVITGVEGFSRNLRKEVSKKRKIYFWDLGIRNALTGQFAAMNKRSDQGGLWENFLFIERAKMLGNSQVFSNRYFWRLQSGAEIDYVEERKGELKGYEFKYGKKQRKAPVSWQNNYPHATYQTINEDNWLAFVLGTDMDETEQA